MSYLDHTSLSFIFQRAFRAIITNVKYQTQDELNTFHQKIKPIIEKILIKCSDANRYLYDIIYVVVLPNTLSAF